MGLIIVQKTDYTLGKGLSRYMLNSILFNYLEPSELFLQYFIEQISPHLQKTLNTNLTLTIEYFIDHILSSLLVLLSIEFH